MTNNKVLQQWKRMAHLKISAIGVTPQFQDKACNNLLLGTPDGVYEDFYPTRPQLHWVLFTGNSYGVAHPGNRASLYRHCFVILNSKLKIKTRLIFFDRFTLFNLKGRQNGLGGICTC